jgi:CHAT domain-containing protein
MEYASLEIGLFRSEASGYSVELRYIDSYEEDRSNRGTARFDFEELRKLSMDAQLYGQKLSEYLFADASVLEMFSTSCGIVLGRPNDKLRLRLFIDKSAPELHGLRWETLTDPRSDFKNSRLLDHGRILFSRYLRSAEPHGGTTPKHELRALVVIANPHPHPEKPVLAPIDVEKELASAKRGLQRLYADKLVSDAAAPGTVTLKNLIEKLRAGFDIVYLVCHGNMLKDPNGNPVPYLWIEDDDGTAAPLKGEDLVDRLRKLSISPRLIVLASCESAGQGVVEDAGGALTALGPRLIQAGVSAVVAMQGKVAMSTAQPFMERFFQQLQAQGQIEEAMAVARGDVKDQIDWWMPVLFSRLRGGYFWYQPGFRTVANEAEFDWDTFLWRLHEGHCTPVIGFGLLESLLGSTREIARNWANTYGFSLEPHNREDLPQVAQYIKIDRQEPRFPYDNLGKYLQEQLRERYGNDFPRNPATAPEERLDELLTQVIIKRAEQDPDEPHQILARLPFEVYLSTNPNNALAAFLERENKKPTLLLCPWNRYVEKMRVTYEKRPTVTEPLVYYLFGQLSKPPSLVLTEDDYFDYLVGTASNKTLIPDAVVGKQSQSQLLFLGFQTDAWNFRVLLRSIQKQRLRQDLDDENDWSYKHIAVQLDPEEERLINPIRAQKWLEKFFGAPANKIGIYKGTSEDFLKELRVQWNKAYPAEAI